MLFWADQTIFTRLIGLQSPLHREGCFIVDRSMNVVEGRDMLEEADMDTGEQGEQGSIVGVWESEGQETKMYA